MDDMDRTAFPAFMHRASCASKGAALAQFRHGLEQNGADVRCGSDLWEMRNGHDAARPQNDEAKAKGSIVGLKNRWKKASRTVSRPPIR
jgi:hypothetical protein